MESTGSTISGTQDLAKAFRDHARSRFRKTAQLLDSTDLKHEAFERAKELVMKDHFKLRPPFEEHGNRILRAILHSHYFEFLLFIVIISNLVLIVYETNLEAKCYPKYSDDFGNCPHAAKNDHVVSTSNFVFVCIYVWEALMKLYVERRGFFRSNQNIIDLIVCVCSVLDLMIEDFQDLAWIRCFRAIRILRIFDLIAACPELRMIVVGFTGSMRAIFFGFGFVLVILVLAAIVLVQFIHPICSSISYDYACERCSRGFSSVQNAVLTLYQQIITGDSWGYISIPIIEKSPVLGMSLCLIQLIVGVGAMNLILAVIVDTAAQARDAKKDNVLKAKIQEEADRKMQLLEEIALLDVENTGTVNKAELVSSVQKDADGYSYDLHKHLLLADVSADDLLIAFDFLDKNREGEVSYLQLCDVLDEFQCADERKLAVLTKLHLNKLERRFRQQQIDIDQIGKKLDGISVLLKHKLCSNSSYPFSFAPRECTFHTPSAEHADDAKLNAPISPPAQFKHAPVENLLQSEHAAALAVAAVKATSDIEASREEIARATARSDYLHRSMESLLKVLHGIEQEASSMKKRPSVSSGNSAPDKVKRALVPMSDDDHVEGLRVTDHILSQLAHVNKEYEITLKRVQRDIQQRGQLGESTQMLL